MFSWILLNQSSICQINNFKKKRIGYSKSMFVYTMHLKLCQGRAWRAFKILNSPKIKNAKEDANQRFAIPVVEISGIMKIASKKPERIELIKNTLANAEGNKGNA